MIAGFDSETCGTMTYSKTSSQNWIIQDSSNDRIFIISVNKNPNLIGEHTLSLQITSYDYPDNIVPKTIEVIISVKCNDPQLIYSKYNPEIWEPLAINEVFYWDIPEYTACF